MHELERDRYVYTVTLTYRCVVCVCVHTEHAAGTCTHDGITALTVNRTKRIFIVNSQIETTYNCDRNLFIGKLIGNLAIRNLQLRENSSFNHRIGVSRKHSEIIIKCECVSSVSCKSNWRGIEIYGGVG